MRGRRQVVIYFKGERMPAKTEDLGEYWLIDGQPVDADRDRCGLGHSDVVVQHVWRHAMLPMLRRMGAVRAAYWLDLAELMEPLIGRDAIDVTECRERFLNWADMMERHGSLTPEQTDDIEQFLWEQSRGVDGRQLLTRETTAIAFGSWREEDAEMVRNYGRRHLGWIRVVGENVDMWEATSKQLQTAADGLHQIFRRSVGRMTFLLQTVSDGRFYRDVPWRVFHFGDPLELAPYATKIRAAVPPGPRSNFTLP